MVPRETKPARRFRRSLRTAAMVLLLFVATDAWLRHDLARQFASGHFRAPADSDRYVVEYLEDLRRRPARTVYFIGDSVIQGAKLADDKTIPAQTGVFLGGEARVVNLGLTAAKIPDFFFLTARVPARGLDVAVYNINYKNFGRFDKGRPLRFHDLYLETPDTIDLAGDGVRAELGLTDPSGGGSGPESWLRENIADRWFLLRNRDAVNAELFGLHPRKLAEGYFKVLARTGLAGAVDRLEKRSREKNWENTRWEPWAVDALRRYYTVDNLNTDNPVFRYVALTSRLARRRGLTPVFFMTPMNRQLMDEYGLVNWEKYGDDTKLLRRAVTMTEGVFLDYTDVVPPRMFVDNDHLNEAGARKLARRLAKDLVPVLSGGGGAP